MYIRERITILKSDTLSKYRTFHHFENYGEIKTAKDYIFYLEWAKQNNKEIFILGNGSNTLFTRKKIETLVLKNMIKPEITCISEDENLYEISTSEMASKVLNYCYKKSLDSFYYLASVPATIGGALAMNAGKGRKDNKSIYDFVESVTYVDSDGSIKVINRSEMDIGFRKTMFTGCQDKFILSAVFKFPKTEFNSENPIKKRVKWSKEHQDNVLPNCGSVFNTAYGPIIWLVRGLRVGKAHFSSKTWNWINNRSRSPIPILSLILIVRIIHFVLLKKCKIELIRVK
ncbi:FAD-binding protein [Alkalihalobacterium alkalinitrilicum]|uniref:FAD-binding protein n=1 Tax=Alkalihalobacterium alkalinitrilicum TaxID=427920 RepID=UPI000994E8F3|nr:FAD-binding protein [Alkalihalobacterium alkalinitrilicum]